MAEGPRLAAAKAWQNGAAGSTAGARMIVLGVLPEAVAGLMWP